MLLTTADTRVWWSVRSVNKILALSGKDNRRAHPNSNNNNLNQRIRPSGHAQAESPHSSKAPDLGGKARRRCRSADQSHLKPSCWSCQAGVDKGTRLQQSQTVLGAASSIKTRHMHNSSLHLESWTQRQCPPHLQTGTSGLTTWSGTLRVGRRWGRLDQTGPLQTRSPGWPCYHQEQQLGCWRRLPRQQPLYM